MCIEPRLGLGSHPGTEAAIGKRSLARANLGEALFPAFAAAWLLTGCLTTVSHDDSPGGNTRDARTGLCDNARPPPCGGVPD